jgi:hypothetical protein
MIFSKTGTAYQKDAGNGMKLKKRTISGDNGRKFQSNTTNISQDTSWEHDGFESVGIKAFPMNGCLETTVTTEVSGPAHGGHGGQQETLQLPTERGILKTVEVDVVSEARGVLE